MKQLFNCVYFIYKQLISKLFLNEFFIDSSIKIVNTKIMTNQIAYLNIDPRIKNKSIIASAEKIISDHCYHYNTYKKTKNAQKYELKMGPHPAFKKDIYSIHINNMIGMLLLFYFDEETNIYRPNSFVVIDGVVHKAKANKLGNIDKDEYCFVRGQISSYY